MKTTAKEPTWIPAFLKFLWVVPCLVASCQATEPPHRVLGPDEVGHVESGVVFPEALGEFQRGDFGRIDEAGRNVHVTYTRFHFMDRLNATIYVSPARRLRTLGSTESQVRHARQTLLDKSFEDVKQAVLKANEGTRQTLEEEFVVELFDQERDAKIAYFVYSQRHSVLDIEFTSMATLIALDQWLVKIRLTAPTDSISRSMDTIRAFHRALLAANRGGLVEDR